MGKYGPEKTPCLDTFQAVNSRNLFFCKGLKQRKDTPGIDLLKVNSQLNKYIDVTSMNLEFLCRYPKSEV